MKLSTRSRYGTRMLLDIALNGGEGPVRISDISKRQGVSVKYLEKLIRPLKKADYIKSKRGPKGGHMLAKPPQEISVGEVVRLLEGELALTECAANGSVCNGSADCIMRQVWVKVTGAMYKQLDALRFSDLVEMSRSGKEIVIEVTD